MCGFAGEFLYNPGDADLEMVRAMARKLYHRGPDEDGAFISQNGRCAIGFQRLRIIDPSSSQQPMSLPDGSITVAFNGEIYNYRQLRRELANDGAVFQSEGDAEVLLHLYQRYGPDMTEKLDGMFSFAVYDAVEGRLMLARDRVGQKPLWYAPLDDRLVFASEAKALLCHPKVGRNVNLKALTYYANFGYIPAPQTAWENIKKLPPAHRMFATEQCGSAKRYWSPCIETLSISQVDAAEKVRSELPRAVEARMVADVPLGALLSGGMDSAIIVALMSQAVGKIGGVRTFTAGFEDQRYDERQEAKIVASHCGTEHTELLIDPAPREMLDNLVEMYDEPFGDSSALPTFLICQAARRHVTVALAGDGGDEVFGGYDRYRAMNISQMMGPAKYLATRLAATFARPFAPLNERNKLRRFIRFANALPYPFATQYLKYRSIFQTEDLSRLFTDDFADKLDLREPEKWFTELYESADFDDETARAQRHDILTYLPDNLLVKTDIASMAASLELRAPMLDHRLIDLGLSLPSELKIVAGRGKAILRDVFGDLLPAEVFNRPKRGFGVPLGRWLREDLRETLCETLMDKSVEKMGIFRPESLAGLINDHLSGKDDHSHRLWSLLVLTRWLAGQQ